MALPRMSSYISSRGLSKNHSLAANSSEETYKNNSQDINSDSFNIYNSNISIAELLKRNEYVIPRASSPTPEQILNVGKFGRGNQEHKSELEIAAQWLAKKK